MEKMTVQQRIDKDIQRFITKWVKGGYVKVEVKMLDQNHVKEVRILDNEGPLNDN